MNPPITCLYCQSGHLAVGDELRLTPLAAPVVILSIDPPATPGGQRLGTVRSVAAPESLPVPFKSGWHSVGSYQITGGPKLTAAQNDPSLVIYITATGKYWWNLKP